MVEPTIWISRERTYVNPGHAFPTPDVGDLGELLDRVSRVLTRPAGTVLLAGDMAAYVGLPKSAPALGGRRKGVLALDTARASGWEIAELRPWTIARRKEDNGRGGKVDRYVHVGVLPWLRGPRVVDGRVRDGGTFPLYDDDAQLMLWKCLVWHRMLGESYRGETPGLVGISMIRGARRQRTPRWVPDWSGIVPAREATETADIWDSGQEHGMAYEHAYDVTSQYCSAAGMVDLAIDALEYREYPNGIDVRPRYRPGYYLISIPAAWTYAGRLPHPAGRFTPGSRFWVTAPTLDLLTECSVEHGMMDPPGVYASWSADGTRVLRDWSATIMGAVREATVQMGDLPEFIWAVKQVYKSGRGLLERHGGPIHRPDWSHAIVARARCELWRKIWREGILSGRWPVKVDADAVWYPSNDGSPWRDWPATFKRGYGVPGGPSEPRGGTFTHYASKEVAPA